MQVLLSSKHRHKSMGWTRALHWRPAVDVLSAGSLIILNREEVERKADTFVLEVDSVTAQLPRNVTRNYDLLHSDLWVSVFSIYLKVCKIHSYRLQVYLSSFL